MGNIITNNPSLVGILIVVFFVLLFISGFIIFFIACKKDKYNDINEDDNKTDFEEDNSLINKKRGKAKTNI